MNDKEIWESYTSRLTPERRRRMEVVASQRLRNLRLVIDDVAHPHNISACLRSAEAFGIKQVDVLSSGERFRKSTAGKGVQPWLDLHRWQEREALIADLRQQGFLICAAFPSDTSRNLADLPVAQPLALVFGNEQDGLSQIWKENCDLPFHIPMRGFVESLNISVAAAISLYTVTQKIMETIGTQALLNETERDSLLRSWCK